MRSPTVRAACLFAGLSLVYGLGLANPAAGSRTIYFRYNGVDADYGRLAVVDSHDPSHRRFIEGFSCEVVALAAGHGICLTADRGAITTFAAKLFDAGFSHVLTIPLQGVPSRCRMSPDGKTASVTVFLSGHAYTSPHFSTQTLLLDTASGKVLANIEEFDVTRAGRPFKAADFNFWGVTFTPDSKRFYCTLNTRGVSYLIQGDIASRTATVLRAGVECPSLSPDGALLAYKMPLPGRRIAWRLQVLDLASMKDTPLRETRSVDDQLQWLDNGRVLYAVSENPDGSSASTDVWLARVDGTAAPELFLAKAYSPAVAR
jgi:hypothetical protein